MAGRAVKIISGITLVGLATYLTGILLQQAALAKKTCVRFGKAVVKQFSLNKAKVELYLEVKNETALAVMLRKQEYRIFVQDKLIAESREKISSVIKPNDYSELALEIEFSPQEVLKTAFQNLHTIINAQSQLKIRIVGKVSFSTLGIIFNNYSFDITSTLADLLKPSETSTPC